MELESRYKGIDEKVKVAYKYGSERVSRQKGWCHPHSLLSVALLPLLYMCVYNSGTVSSGMLRGVAESSLGVWV